MSFYPEVLEASQKKILRRLGPVMAQRHFYLGGGTALALHLGHRHSVDLYWFSAEPMADPLRLAADIRSAGIPFQSGLIDRGTLHGKISGVRVSFLEYLYPLLERPLRLPKYAIRIASRADLSCMKLSALAQRGSRKDFLDIYALGLRYKSLADILRLYQKKFSVMDIAHVLYALAFFEDADRERMPRMIWPANWRTTKSTIMEWVKEVAIKKSVTL